MAFCGDPNDDIILKNNENLIINKDVNDHCKDLFVIRKEIVTDFDKKGNLVYSRCTPHNLSLNYKVFMIIHFS